MAEFIAKLIAYGTVGVAAGPVVAVFITPIFLVLRLYFYVPLVQKKILEKAKQEGHVIEATLYRTYAQKERSSTGMLMETGRRVGDYKYEYKGKTRKYGLVSINNLPEKINLYYIKNPKKAVTANYLGMREVPWFKSYLIISVILIVVILIIGMVLG